MYSNIKNKLKLNKKGMSMIIIYTGIFILSLSLLGVMIPRFILSSERATVYQAVDGAARQVADKIYKHGFTTLETSGDLPNNKGTNMSIAQEYIDSVSADMFTGNIKLTDVQLNESQGKVVVTCNYHYSTSYMSYKKGIKTNKYNKKMVVKGVAYLKSVEYKE